MTLADRIRAVAAERCYWELPAAERRGERKEIAYLLECETRAVTDALKRSSKLGKPRNPALTRCEKCGQALPAAPHAASAESTAPTP